uniref:GIY-YIG endonuclease n=1 Tax=Orbilia oligospora TaxID=2813651 RepID=A0A6G6A3H4_ORBOL|nr:GIY-YIG endonuclease [Orbilia oligospora]
MKVHMKIYKAILKHGHSKFSVEILEYCDSDCLIKKEQYYLDLLKPEYNTLKIAGSPLGYKHTEEAIEKLKKLGTGRKHSEEAKAKIRAANLGNTLSAEIRSKISSSRLKLNFKHTESAKLKIGASSVARFGSITYVTDIKTGKTEQYLSRRQAAFALNIAPLTIKRYIESNKLYNDRYRITE